MKIRHFWIVIKPRRESVIEDVLYRTDWPGLRLLFLGGLRPDEILAVYDNRPQAAVHARALLRRVAP